MTHDTTIFRLAADVQAGKQGLMLCDTLRDAVWAARERAEMAEACRVIMERFPGEFPLHGARASE